MDKVSHMLRRSRLRPFAAAAHHALPFLPREDVKEEILGFNETELIENVMRIALEKRLTAAEVEALQSSARLSAIKAASETAAAAAAAAAKTTTTAAAAAKTTATTTKAVQTTTTHSAYVFSDKFGNVVTSTAATTTKTSAAAKSTVPASSVIPTSKAAASSVIPSSSVTPSSIATTARATTTSSTPVLTITQNPSTTSSATVSQITGTDANAAAGKSTTSNSGLSTGAIAGIVVAVLVGLVVVGSTIGWLYRKYANRSYSTKKPWSKIDDDDITPFPPNEKLMSSQPDDIYGNSPAPVIGSRRALALARQNAFNGDGSLRPASDYMIERGQNRAGVGSGMVQQHAYGAYPNLPSPDYEQYSVDPQGRPYNPHAGRTPMPHMYEDIPAGSPYALSAPGNSRQLIGPNGYPQPELSPVALGRPAPPTSNFAISQHEDFADMPDPETPTMDHQTSPYTPRTATTHGEWAGDARPPQNRSRVSMTTPRGLPGSDAIVASRMSPTEMMRPPPPAATQGFPMAYPTPASLPSFEPMSPLMSGFDLRRSSSQPLAMYDDERSTQKRMYGEVANAAGVAEPPTPRSAAPLNDSTNSTDSSFSAHDPMPRLPSLTLNPPQPYMHGQPLSPLVEMPTPMSSTTQATSSTAPAAPSSSVHGQSEFNPFERTLLPPRAALAPPYSASTAGATGIPSPAYPPPSPGGMSVPGSVTDSPRRWSGDNAVRARRVESVFDEDDAYGGI